MKTFRGCNERFIGSRRMWSLVFTTSQSVCDAPASVPRSSAAVRGAFARASSRESERHSEESFEGSIEGSIEIVHVEPRERTSSLDLDGSLRDLLFRLFGLFRDMHREHAVFHLSLDTLVLDVFG